MKAIVLLSALILTAFATFARAQAVDSTQAYPNSSASPALLRALPNSLPPSPVQPTVQSAGQYGPASFRQDGFWISTADKSTQLHVHGYAQADDRMFSSNMHGRDFDTFLFRRIRPLFEGIVLGNVDFRFMPDFGQNNPQIQEAFLELKTLPFAKLRVGKFKEPIGLEVLRQDRDLTFPERSLASDLVPLRYIGVQLSGSLFSESISYAGGYFNGSSDGSNGVFTQWTDANEATARVFFHPFATTGTARLRQLGLGVAGSAGDQHGPIAGLKTMAQTTFFKYSSSTEANGQHNRLEPQAYYYAGPFGVMGEYVISSQEVLNKGTSARVRNEAWQVEGSVMVTGEKNSYGTIRARNSFEPNRGFRHMGAVELALRYSQVRIDGDVFPRFANPATAPRFAGELGIGVNWILNRNVKLTTDYEHTGFRMAPGSTTPLHSENVLISRIQLQF
jgi:phosphate-selective porin OprO/OprP